MSKLAVLKAFLSNPKEIMTQGYMAVNRKSSQVNWEQLAIQKFGKNEFPTVDLLELLPGLNETLSHYSFLPGTSMITDIALLRGLARKYPSCEYMEIGSFRGESIRAVSDVAANCTSVTLSAKEMTEMNFGDDFVRTSGIYSNGVANIHSVYHNSLTFDFSTLNKKFDLIFVDGDHTYDAIVSDTRNVFKLLKNEQSIIVWHDYAYDAAAVRHEVMAAIAEGTPKEYHRNLYHVSNSMCAIFVRGNVKGTHAFDNVYPNKVFTLNVSARPL